MKCEKKSQPITHLVMNNPLIPWDTPLEIMSTTPKTFADKRREAAAAVTAKELTDAGLRGMIPSADMKNVGDVNSTARGSGARFNAGKAPIELIPLRVIAEHHAAYGTSLEADALFSLARFQEGGTAADLLDAIQLIGPAWDECAAVFDYGRRKYAEWNWAKGMSWNIPIACAARHLVFGMMAGEEVDPESGHPHRGHFLCNIVMLLTFIRTYPGGDDRPSKWLSVAEGERL